MIGGLRSIHGKEREKLIEQLWQTQNGRCFISEKAIDLAVHKNDLDIDHIIPTRDNGPDNVSNWALTFEHYNRSKQAADLRVARVLCRFEQIKEGVTDTRGVNLSHVLENYGGAKHRLGVAFDGQDHIKLSLSAVGKTDVLRLPVWLDKLSGMRSAFAMLPIEYIFHDDRINPRGIGNNLRGLVIEFFCGLPQLHVPLAWIDTGEDGGCKVRVFDGQHKAAAQVLLGVKQLPLRIFIDPDPEVLLTANTHAGTSLRQVAFDKATQRHLGASIYLDRVKRFREDRGLADDYNSYTEQQLVDHFKGEQAQMRRYVIDAQRNQITYHPENRLREFIEMGGKGTERPLSYSAIEKAVYSQTIFGGMLDTPDDHKIEAGENPRQLECEQIIRLLNLIADQIYIGKWDPEVGASKLESKIQNNQDIPENHLRAHRMGREEILQAWIELLLSVCQNAVVVSGQLWDKDKPFHRPLPTGLWSTLEHFIRNFSNLPIWKNRALASTVFGGKQNVSFWKDAFQTGVASGITILPNGGVNLVELMKSGD